MPRIASIDIARADAGVQATLAGVKTKIGMVPNLLSTFAQSPAVLSGCLALSDALGKGVLTAKQREIVSLAVAQANECHYCLSAHTLMGKGAGLKAFARPARARPKTPLTTPSRASRATWSTRAGRFQMRILPPRARPVSAMRTSSRSSQTSR
jgi:AhpD family alkylhydroperoxidase